MTARRLAVAGALVAGLATAVVRAEPQAAPDDELPRFSVAGPAGFGVRSADGRSMLATHWLLETDFVASLDGDSPAPARDSFILRFAGMRLDAVLERDFHAQLFVNFADNRVTVIEGWIEARLTRWARLRAGSFPFPITEERLTPGIALPFVSTSVAAMLLPARDTGLQLLGQVAGLVSYNLALVNGAFAIVAGAGAVWLDASAFPALHITAACALLGAVPFEGKLRASRVVGDEILLVNEQGQLFRHRIPARDATI